VVCVAQNPKKTTFSISAAIYHPNARVQIEDLRAAYMPEAVAMAEGWVREEGVVSPYSMLWAVAAA
jgi:hypothetical protein